MFKILTAGFQHLDRPCETGRTAAPQGHEGLGLAFAEMFCLETGLMADAVDRAKDYIRLFNQAVQ